MAPPRSHRLLPSPWLTLAFVSVVGGGIVFVFDVLINVEVVAVTRRCLGSLIFGLFFFAEVKAPTTETRRITPPSRTRTKTKRRRRRWQPIRTTKPESRDLGIDFDRLE